MIGIFIRERRSWIAMFVALQLLVLFVAVLDPSVPIASLLYVILLSSLLFAGFLFARYHRETRFYKSLDAWDDTCDPGDLAEPAGPFERMTLDKLMEQSERYKRDSSMRQIEHEEEKDDLLSWIHEVKTPLTAMQLIIDRLDDEKAKSRLMYEWLRIHLLLDQQLHRERIPFMENDLFIERTELAPVVHQEIRMLKSWCMQKGIGFDVSLPAAEALTDAKWLGFILRQLLTNAVKYSEASDIIVESEREDGRVRLRVRDFGRGIDAKDMPRIFDKGFTSTSLHQDAASTGMGLYLARKAADALQIRIEAESAPGAGTTFTLTFPRQNDFARVTGM